MKPKFFFEKSSLSILQKSIIENLETDGVVQEDEHGYQISLEQAAQISDINRNVLGIPLSIPHVIHIGGNGMLNEPKFSFVVSIRENKSSENISFAVENSLFVIGGRKFLPSVSQSLVFRTLTDHQEKEHSFDENLSALARLKKDGEKLVKDGKLAFDGYLSSENAIFADKLRLDFLENNDGSINVVPSIDHASDNSFKKAFNTFPKVKEVYNAQVADQRVRVVVPREDEIPLKKLKEEFRKLNGEKKDRVLKNPSDFFEESIFDLDHYSKRVYELGYYEPKYYPFIKPFRTDWVSGVTIEEASGKRTEILLESEEEFSELSGQIKAAESTGSVKVEFKEHQIPLEDAVSLRDSYKAIKEKRVSKTGFRDSNGKKVLIIHENVDGVDYEADTPQEIRHVFIPPRRLKPVFKLLPHQIEGVAWLQSLSRSNSGALLGDDMGLGKTLQILSYVDWTIDYQTEIGTNKPNIIVAPVTLLENWENEFKRFFEPQVRFRRYFGKAMQEIDLFNLDKEDVILTTYETLRSKQLVLGRINWYSAILDEAQRIKTPGTLVTNAAKALNAEFKIAMTGTPVENSWMDLWCLTDFIAPGLLGSGKEFNRKYNNSLKDQDVDLRALGDEIRGQMGVYLKRRLKSQILKDLPSKEQYFLPCQMPSIQVSRYQEELDYYQKNKGTLSQILTTISKLRMISDHPFLDKDPEEIDVYTTQELIQSSAKVIETIKILEAIKQKGEKVILFSHFDKVQSILSRMVIDYFGIPVSIINGQTATVETKGKESRQKLIDRFQAVPGFNIIIMSPIAAGYGLNVTEANHVIHFTRHWNPAKENQATDRVYRIGQKRMVHIYYPMAIMDGREAFDQKLDKLLKMKIQLSDASLYPSESAEVKFSDFEDLLA